MTMTPVGHLWSLTFLAIIFAPLLISATPINRQVGISENVFITVQNDTYGIEQRVCSIDSMTYGDGETIPTSSPCEHCICRPPGFACTIISCEYRPGCKSFKRSNQCCPEYQCECEKDGKIYQNGEKIMDSNNPCEICYCQGGEIICAVIDCYWRSDCQPRYIENRCCPLYDHCPPPSNQGPFPRPTIPTTTTSSGFPWYNLSSAVYELPVASSVSPYPLLESTTTPTTTPTLPELVVLATEKSPVHTNIMATAQEEASNILNETTIPSDSQPVQQIVEIHAQEPSLLVPVEQKVQEMIPLAQNLMHVLPVHHETNETVLVNESLAVEQIAPVVSEASPVVTEALSPVITETAPVVIEETPVVSEAAPVVTEASPVVSEAAPAVIGASTVIPDAAPVVTEASPVVSEAAPVVTEASPFVSEAAPVVTEETPVVSEAAPVVTEAAPVVSETAHFVAEASPVVSEAAPVVTEQTPVISEAAPVVTEAAPVVSETAHFVTEASPVVSEASPVDSEATPLVIEVAPVVIEVTPVVTEINETANSNPEILAETNETPEVTEAIYVNDDHKTVPVSFEAVQNSEVEEIPAPVPEREVEVPTTLSPVLELLSSVIPEINDSVPAIPDQVDEIIPENDDSNQSVTEAANTIDTDPIIQDEVKETVPVTEEVKEELPVQEIVNDNKVEVDAPSSISTNLAANLDDTVPDKVTIEILPEINHEVPVQAIPQIYPVMVDIGTLNPESNETPEIVPEMNDSPVVLQPSAPSIIVTDSTTLFVAPAVSFSIIPSPVEEILVSQQAAVVPPEILSQVTDDHEVVPLAQESISQSENAIQVDDKTVSPTETLPNSVSSLVTETVSGSHSVPSVTENEIVPTDREEINPSSVATPENSQFTSTLFTLPEVSDEPTTTAPQEDTMTQSVSFDEVPQLPEEPDQTTVKEISDDVPTQSPVLKPEMSITTILMPPNREPIADEPSSTDSVPLEDQKTMPNIELQPPTEEFVPVDDEPAEPLSATTVSSVQENNNVVEAEPEKIQDYPSVIQNTYLPEKVISDEITVTTTSPVEAEVPTFADEPKPSENIPVEQSPPVLVETEFFEDSPVHIQGSDSYEASLLHSQSVNELDTDAVVIESEKTMEDSPVESVTEAAIADETATNPPPAIPEIESTAIPEVQLASVPIESPKEEEEVKVQDEPEVVTSTQAAPAVQDIVYVPEQIPSVQTPLAADNTFEIIPPQTDNVPSPPEILNQIREKDNEVQEETHIPSNDATSPQEDFASQPDAIQNSAHFLGSDDDTVEIFAENLAAETTTQLPQVDKKMESDAPVISELGLQDDTVEVLAGPADPLSSDSEIPKTTLSPVLPEKEEEILASEDEQEEIHPDDQHEDDQDQVILTTAEPPQADETIIPTTSSSLHQPQSDDSEGHEESVHNDDAEQEDESPTTEAQELHRDEPEVVDEQPSSDATTTDRNSALELEQNDDPSPMTTVQPTPELMNKVQKVVQKLKSKDDEDTPTDSISESKFRLDLSAFDSSEEELGEEKAAQNLISSVEEVQSTPTSFSAKLATDDVVFDEVQQTQTQVPAHLQPVEPIQTTPGNMKFGREDMELSEGPTTVSPLLRDDSSSFTTTNNPGRSEDLDVESVPTTQAPEKITTGEDNQESKENFINDEEAVAETTTSRGSYSLRQEDTPEATTVSSSNPDNKTETILRSELNTDDFVELPTGSPLGFAAVYHDDPQTTTTKGTYRGDSVTDDATTTEENIIFDEEPKSQEDNVIPTTQESVVVKAKSESLVDDEVATTPLDVLLNDESSIVTTNLPATTNESSGETTTTARIPGRIDQMIIPAKGFPQIDPVTYEMIPRKEDKLARLDLNDDDSWFYQTFNKIRQMTGLFPSPNRQKKLTRQPRDVSDESAEQKPKTYYKKTKKATEEELNKLPRRKSFLPSRSFLFF